MTTTTFDTIPLHLITASLTNPRKTFHPGKLQELADSIAAGGVHQPVLVRPLPPERLQDTFANRIVGEHLAVYELVCGERRFRASQMAKQATIPAMIRPLTDAQVLKAEAKATPTTPTTEKIAPAAAARDQKITAGEATQGIAAALQGLSAGPDGEPAGTSTEAPKVGIKVTINDQAKWHDSRKQYVGRMGYLSEVQPNGKWLVRMTGKRGAVADFVAFEREELDVEA